MMTGKRKKKKEKAQQKMLTLVQKRVESRERSFRRDGAVLSRTAACLYGMRRRPEMPFWLLTGSMSV